MSKKSPESTPAVKADSSDPFVVQSQIIANAVEAAPDISTGQWLRTCPDDVLALLDLETTLGMAAIVIATMLLGEREGLGPGYSTEDLESLTHIMGTNVVLERLRRKGMVIFDSAPQSCLSADEEYVARLGVLGPHAGEA